MTNLPKLTNRAKQALDILADGGQFVHRLERNSYTGFEKFCHRLVTRPGSWNSTVKGIGFATFHELDNLGFLSLCERTNSVCTYYKLNTEAGR